MAKPENSTVDIKAAVGRQMSRIRTLCEGKAAQAEQIAKANAPWNDQTGNARSHLKGFLIDENTESGGGTLGFGVAHRVEYGQYLENAHDGKNAILKPTIESMRAEFLEKVRQIVGGRFG